MQAEVKEDDVPSIASGLARLKINEAAEQQQNWTSRPVRYAGLRSRISSVGRLGCTITFV